MKPSVEHRLRLLCAALLCACAAGCASSVTGFRTAGPLPQVDTVGVDATCRTAPESGRLVVLATGQHTALDADFDLFVAMVLPANAARGDTPLGPDAPAKVIVVRSSGEVQAFLMQELDVTSGSIRWQGGRPVVHLRAEGPAWHSSSIRQVPHWQAIETTLRCDGDPEAFDRMAGRFCTMCMLSQQPRGPVEQMVRLLRALNQTAEQVESALDPFAPRR